MPAGITYAGQRAVLDINETVARFVAARWPASRWPFAHNRADIPVSASPFAEHEIADRFRLPYPEVPAPRVNEVIIPTGASRYGRGLFLFGRDQMAMIANQVWGYYGDLSHLPEQWGGFDNLAPLRIEYGRGINISDVFTRQMRALPPVRLDVSGGNLWLLPLVDHRFEWMQRQANAVLPQGTEWSQLFTILGWSLEQTVNLSPGASHGVPDRESFSDPGVPAPVALDAAALSVGVRPVPTETGGIAFSNPASANATLQAFLPLVKGWLGGRVPKRRRPGKLAVVCRTAVDHFGQCGKASRTQRNIGGGSPSLAEIIVHSPYWLEHYRNEVSSQNLQVTVDSGSFNTLEAIAGAIANSINAWGGRQHSISVPGVFDWPLTGHDDYLSIRVGGIDNRDAVSTHVQSLPPDFAPLVHLGLDQAKVRRKI